MNYTFKGTPGPWVPVYDDNGFYLIVSKDSTYILATGGEGDIDEANVKLASRSPQMFEMLKEICEVAKKFDLRGKIDYEKIEKLLKEATS